MARLRKVVIAILVVILIASAGALAYDLFRYLQGDRLYDNIRRNAVENDSNLPYNTDPNAENPYEDLPAPQIDFSGLPKNCVAYLTCPAVGISYPIMYSGDDNYYLHRAPSGKYLYAGSLFLEGANKQDFSDPNSFVYGHNMKNGSMFAKLRRYSNQTTYDSYPAFWINFRDGSARLYHIFSLHETKSRSSTYQIFPEQTNAFVEWMKNEQKQSIIPTTDPLDIHCKTVTLSTCAGGGRENVRFVVSGVLVYTRQ